MCSGVVEMVDVAGTVVVVVVSETVVVVSVVDGQFRRTQRFG